MLHDAGYYKLTIYNITGQKIATLADEEFYAGTHNVVFNAHDLA